MLKGNVPGAPGSWVLLNDAVKIGKQPVELPFPAGLKSAAKADTKAKDTAEAPAESKE
jgi:hypothetical protein